MGRPLGSKNKETHLTDIIGDHTMTTAIEPRALATIALEIRMDWKKVYFGAVPYLDAMTTMGSVHSDYGCDSGESIVLYFLSNATSWKGETARRIKAELKALVK
jgi:hypothetical protein